jgi:hypothetical protein
MKIGSSLAESEERLFWYAHHGTQVLFRCNTPIIGSRLELVLRIPMRVVRGE